LLFIVFIKIKYFQMMKADILAIGAHPDDVELGCGGTIISHVQKGCTVVVLDLTRGELGTRGSAEIREQEAAKAAGIMGIAARENLNLKDGFFQNDENTQLMLIQYIRKYRPDIVLTNAPADRHPDHARAAQLTRDACFLSGLPKIETTLDGIKQQAWRPRALYHYIQALYHQPHFVVNITEHIEQKMMAIKAYASQFYNPASAEPETFISKPEFLDFVYARAASIGALSGYRYAEGFLANRYLGVNDLRSLY
jgi:bacillithiol biosynthesis deacetylase BshB1